MRFYILIVIYKDSTLPVSEIAANITSNFFI